MATYFSQSLTGHALLNQGTVENLTGPFAVPDHPSSDHLLAHSPCKDCMLTSATTGTAGVFNPSDLNVGDPMLPVYTAHDARNHSTWTNFVAVLHALLQQRLHCGLPSHWRCELPKRHSIPQHTLMGCTEDQCASRFLMARLQQWQDILLGSCAARASMPGPLVIFRIPVAQGCLVSCQGRRVAARQHWRSRECEEC